MNLQRLDFLLVVTMAAAAAAPALGQTGVGPGRTPTQSAASIPDFSGIWVHPTLPGFEAPFIGARPGEESFACAQRRGQFPPLVGDYTNPILGKNCEEARRSLVSRRHLSDPEQPVLARRCA